MKSKKVCKRIFAILLLIAVVICSVTIPKLEYTTTVEAADESEYKIAVPDGENGFKRVDPGTVVEYVGLMDSMQVWVMDDKMSMPTGITYTWTSAFGNVLHVGEEQEREPDSSSKWSTTINNIYVYKIGPGMSTITAEFDHGGRHYSPSVVIKVSLDINKTVNRPTDGSLGDNFTTLLKDDPSASKNTALFFYENASDIKDEKVVTLLNNTKSTPTSVTWLPGNPNIAEVIPQKNDNDPVKIKANHAGVTVIEAQAISEKSMVDKFYAIVTPFFIDNNNQKVKILNTPDDPLLIIPENGFLDTNAMSTTDLTWKVKVRQENGTFVDAKDSTGRDLITLKPQENSSKVYIESSPMPRAGVYEITCQTKPAGVKMDDNLGIAKAYIRITLDFMKEESISMSVGDTYNLYDNTTVQDPEDWVVMLLDGADWWYDPGNKLGILGFEKNTGVFTGKNQGAVRAKITLNPTKATKYSLDKDDLLITTGKTVVISVNEAFAINSRNLTMTLNQVSNLVVSTTSTMPITWTSSSPDIVKITGTNNAICTIQAKQVGTSVITAKQIVNGVTKTAQCTVKVLKSADSIKIEPNPVKMNVNEFQTLTAKITPTGEGGELAWKSSDEKVVKIDKTAGNTAVIKSMGSGIATITVINLENAIIDTCTVTVYGKITEMKLVPSEALVTLANKQLQLGVTVTPATEAVPDVIWTSGNNKVATVDGNGLVKFVSAGTVVITAVARNNPEIQASSTIRIIKTADGLKLESSNKVIYVGEVIRLNYKISPSDADNQKVKWKSSNTGVAKVDESGNITGVSIGETTIIAQAEDGNWVDTCVITVKEKARGISIKTKDVTLNKGDTYSVEYKLIPETSTEANLTWATNNAAVATVSSSGKITAVDIGSAIISVRTEAGEVAYCNVTVIEKASGIKLNFTDKTIYTGTSFTLRATLMPTGTSNRKVTWTSSNPKVATISATGLVKGLIPGTTIITCTSEDGGYQERCIVTVKKRVTTVKLNYKSYSLGLNRKLQLKATVTSPSATNKKVKWTSSNPGIAYVSSKGLVTGRKKGTVTITAHSLDGSGVTAKCTIKVVVPTTSIKLNKRNMTMLTGRSTKLIATISPKTATYRTVTWTSSDPSVVNITYDGIVTALKPGTARIEAKSKDSGGAKKAYCLVIVKDPISSTAVTITTKNPMMIPGKSLTMQKAITPPNSTDKVTWSSDNNVVATIDKATGKLVARGAGTATITLISESGKMDSTTVTVLGLNQTSVTMEQYTQHTLYITGATGRVTWTVANPTIAVVNNGVIESRKPGTTTVFADVNGIRLSCKIIVTEIGN